MNALYVFTILYMCLLVLCICSIDFFRFRIV